MYGNLIDFTRFQPVLLPIVTPALQQPPHAQDVNQGSGLTVTPVQVSVMNFNNRSMIDFFMNIDPMTEGKSKLI